MSSSSQRYSSLPSSVPPPTVHGQDDEQLLALEDVQPEDEDDEVDEGKHQQQQHQHNDDDDSSDARDVVGSAGLVQLHVPSSATELDRDSSLSSRHSESHPFDQDVRHMEHGDMQRLHGQQATPTNRQAGTVAAAAAAAAATARTAGTSATAVVARLSNSSPFLAPPVASGASGGLRKSVSIGDKLAGRARELAVAQGRRLDAMVRGIEAEPEYVEDHILETLDYDNHDDTMNELAIEKSGALHTNYLLLLKVLMMVLIGFVTAMLMYCVTQGVQLLFTNKIAATTALIASGQAAGAYFAFVFLNLAITAVASSLVAIVAPHARGGGVPYALSYLNGTNVAPYFSPRIVLVKTVSLIFTISGGLTLGMEGPFVFIGGGVALLCSNLIDRLFPFFFIGFGSGGRRRFSKVIRNIREERIFMAGGLAAGLAVAFDAPIAGVLFALEGSTTFLTVPVVLRIFGCAMFASFFNDLGHNNFNEQVINHNLLQPTEAEQPPWAFSIPEVLPFTVLGLIGGLAGAGATWMNIRMTRWRHHHLEGNTWRHIGLQIAEVAVFSFATSTVWFVLPYVFGCRQQTDVCGQSVEGGGTRCPQLQCPAGYYSEIGAFVFASSDEIARLLFDRSLSYSDDYHVGPLIVYGLAYWVLVSLIYGAFVPGGLFVPSIVVGGLYGRVMGIFVEWLFPSAYINPGVYALLGAASMLGGFTRLVLPVVLMLIELTGDATYLLPIMYCAVVGKFSADALYGALYPQHMAIEKIPTLTDKVNPAVSRLHAGELMIGKDRLACLQSIERLSVLRTVLLNSRRVRFPLLSPGGQLRGVINRQAVMQAVTRSRSYSTYEEAALLEDSTSKPSAAHRGSSGLRRASTGGGDEAAVGDWHQSTVLNNNALSSSSFVDFEDNFVNLQPYADQGTITAHPSTPAKRLVTLFRRLGLSHLPVTDKQHRFVGFVTRRCLIVPPTSNSTPAPAHKQHDVQHELDATQQTQTDIDEKAALKWSGGQQQQWVQRHGRDAGEADNGAEGEQLPLAPGDDSSSEHDSLYDQTEAGAIAHELREARGQQRQQQDEEQDGWADYEVRAHGIDSDADDDDADEGDGPRRVIEPVRHSIHSSNPSSFSSSAMSFAQQHARIQQQLGGEQHASEM